MIKDVLKILMSNDHFNQSEFIEIAKGKYEIQTTLKGGLKQLKRIWKTK
jgi:hypothetical protein